MSKIYIISEEATPSKIEILEETAVPGLIGADGIPFGNQAYRVKFRARLQTANEVNNNKRTYGADTLQEVFNQLKPKVDAGKLLGELDHPQVVTTDKNGQLKRSSTILLQNSCVHFQELTFDGTHIDAIVQTTTNRAGLDAYSFIKDGVTIGFSLRAFGDIEQGLGGVVKVIPKGLKAITYDFVAMPSHNGALILEMLNESTDPMELVKDLKQFEETLKIKAEEKGVSLIEEASIDTVDPVTGKICTNGICMLQPIEETIDYLMQSAITNKNFKKLRIKF